MTTQPGPSRPCRWSCSRSWRVSLRAAFLLFLASNTSAGTFLVLCLVIPPPAECCRYLFFEFYGFGPAARTAEQPFNVQLLWSSVWKLWPWQLWLFLLQPWGSFSMRPSHISLPVHEFIAVQSVQSETFFVSCSSALTTWHTISVTVTLIIFKIVPHLHKKKKNETL